LNLYTLNHYFLLTIDVEDWFQVENFKRYIPFDSWSSYELRIEKNTHRILDLLDSVKLNNSTNLQPVTGSYQVSTENVPKTKETSLRRRRILLDHFHPESDPDKKKSKKSGKSCQTTPKATFFVLGWLAERLPHLVREIHSRGHEVASHGYYHNLCNAQSPEDLKTDLCDSKSLLEDIIGTQVYGYRAPSFAINNDILKIIEDCDYLYDSSYNSFAMHGRYGQISVSQNGQKGIARQIPNAWNTKHGTRNPDFIGKPETFYELPISNLYFRTPFRSRLSAISSEQNHLCFVLPWGGGGYFRLTPFPLFKLGVQSSLKKRGAYLFYMHPWEIDPEQPRVNEASMFYKFRHYSNLSKTHSKLTKLIKSFSNCSFFTCHQYLRKTCSGQEAGQTGGEAEGVVESR
jgi:polysaccharide deacetylase family protein (PEP-CTERM system associated)